MNNFPTEEEEASPDCTSDYLDYWHNHVFNGGVFYKRKYFNLNEVEELTIFLYENFEDIEIDSNTYNSNQRSNNHIKGN